MKTVYGPVPSWRLGNSLGIDPICRKACSFDCIYCQVGGTESKTAKRKNFVDGKKVERELQQALQKTKPDVITFSGMGEPTLAMNLGEITKTIRKNSNLPIAILTNSSLLYIQGVRKVLQELDIVCAKLDACNEKTFEKINKPVEGITFQQTFGGIKKLSKKFKGKLALQVMFVEENREKAEEIASAARELNPDEVQINTPLRSCPVKPLSRRELDAIKEKFSGLKTVSVYDAEKPDAKALDLNETMQRRPSEGKLNG